MKVIRPKCQGTYRHYLVPVDTAWDDPEEDGSQMRELLLVCARCSFHLWITSIVRPWVGLLPDDWGT